LGEKELKDALILAGLNQELVGEIINYSQTNEKLILSYLESMKLETPSYNEIEWRIDVKTATKSLNKICQPEILMKLSLNDSDSNRKVHVVQTDPVNLEHLINSLDEALNEIKTNYCRRIFRNIQ
jgi:hypothetical protein